MPIQVKQVPVEAIVDLRHAILRAGLPRESALFSGDELPTSRHFAALSPDGQVLGCLTLHLNQWRGKPAFQLRGMATDPAARRTGLGRLLMGAAEAFVRNTPVTVLWCNARLPAVGFYQRLGWRIVSDPFEIPTAGPHVQMERSLNPSQPGP